MKAIVFGEVVWDEYPHGSFIGGAPFNFAAHLSKLGNDVAFISAVGDDENGEKTIDIAKSFGIKSTFIYKNMYNSGRCKVTLDETKKPHFSLDPDSAYDHVIISDDEAMKIESFNPNMLYFGTLAIRNEVSRLALGRIISACKNVEIFCDINLRDNCYTPDSINFCLKSAKILKISRDEEMQLIALGFLDDNISLDINLRCRVNAKHLQKTYPNIKLLIVTLDKDGAVLHDIESGKTIYSPPMETNVLSTVGAGDSFFAALTDAYKKDLPLEICLRRAIILSSFVVSKIEAVPNYTSEIFEK